MPEPAVLDRFPDIRHLRWIQDNQFGQEDYRQQSAHAASDICYFATSRLQNVIPLQGRHHTGTLRFAANPAAQPATDAPSAAFALVAYIPAAPLLDASFQISAWQRFTGWDYLSYLDRTQQYSLDTALEQLDDIVETFLQQQGTRSDCLPPEALRLFREEYFRAFNRLRLTRQVLSLGQGCRIYGTPEWQSWAEFQPYFHGSLVTPPGKRRRVPQYRHQPAQRRHAVAPARIRMHGRLGRDADGQPHPRRSGAGF